MSRRLLLAAAFLLSAIADAQTITGSDAEGARSLPAALSGDVALTTEFGNVRVSAPLTLTLTTETSSTFTGVLSYGAGQCGTSSTPIKGTFDGTHLVFSGRLPTCGDSVFELSRVGPGEFTGRVSFGNDQEISPGSTLRRIVHLER